MGAKTLLLLPVASVVLTNGPLVWLNRVTGHLVDHCIQINGKSSWVFLGCLWLSYFAQSFRERSQDSKQLYSSSSRELVDKLARLSLGDVISECG